VEFTGVRRNEHSPDFCFYMVGAKNFPGDKISGLGFFLLPSGKKQIQMLTWYALCHKKNLGFWVFVFSSCGAKANLNFDLVYI